MAATDLLRRPELKSEVLVLPVPTFVPRRYQPGYLANWSGHLAFANDLISQVKPALLVELGTHYGESYFGMCQSVLDNGLDTVCYAIDHWLGEEHAGFYGEEVFNEVNGYNTRFYRTFSYLLRSTFDDALRQFDEESIDLLHIDGLHTYEAASHDFYSWLPKVKPGGIILLHDVMVRHADFGIWKLWRELKGQFRDTFAFHHSWGLGVLRKPGATVIGADFLDFLFTASEEVCERIRRHYVLYASYLDRLFITDVTPVTGPKGDSESKSEEEGDEVLFQVFWPDRGGYSEARSLQRPLKRGEWNNFRFDLPDGISGQIRIDPCDRTCILQVNSIQLIDAALGASVWTAHTPSALKALQLSEAAVFLPQEDTCRIFTFGTDPQLTLPPLHSPSPISLEVSVRLEENYVPLLEALNPLRPRTPVDTPALAEQIRPESGNEVLVQIYPYNEPGYAEDNSATAHVEAGCWDTLSFELGPGGFAGPFRLDPADTPCVAELGDFEVIDAATEQTLLYFREASELRQFAILNSALYLPGSDRCLIFCFGRDPQLQLTPPSPITGAVRIRLSIRIELQLDTVAALLRTQDLFTANDRDRLLSDIETVKTELKASQLARLLLASELSQVASEKTSLLRDRDEALKHTQSRLDEAQGRLERITAEKEAALQHETACHRTLAERESAFQDFHARFIELQEAYTHSQSDTSRQRSRLTELEKQVKEKEDSLVALRTAVETSLSWRVTKPMRDIMRLIRRH